VDHCGSGNKNLSVTPRFFFNMARKN
jgi:hypothetical protein